MFDTESSGNNVNFQIAISSKPFGILSWNFADFHISLRSTSGMSMKKIQEVWWENYFFCPPLTWNYPVFLLFGTKFGPNRYLLFEILNIDIKFEISFIELVSVQNFMENWAVFPFVPKQFSIRRLKNKFFGTKFGPNRCLLFEIPKIDYKVEISIMELVNVQIFVENKAFLHFKSELGRIYIYIHIIYIYTYCSKF